MTKMRMFADSLLSKYHKSCWVVKGVAALVTSLNLVEPGTRLNDRSNETFERLIPNLADPNHFLRLYTLQILDSYPKRPFVTDHADLDLTDDLEEEPSYNPDAAGEGIDKAPGRSEMAGPCDIISLLRTIETIPVAFPNERKITSHIGRVEVYAGTGKLPPIYAESAVCHMLGLLHVKFAPIWPAAVRAIVALLTYQEGPTWPCVYSALEKSLQKSEPGFDSSSLDKDRGSMEVQNNMTNQYAQCMAWEKSKGTYDMFGSRDSERQVVSRGARADELTVFGNLWSIMASAQNLTVTKSKQVIPLFFEFMVDQYYVFHPDDPDARECNLSEVVDSRYGTDFL